MNRTILLAVSLCLVACGGTVDQSEDMSVLHFKDAKQATSSGNLIDHGGKVLPASNTVAIWWGNQSAFPSDAQAGIDAMLEGLQGSTFLNISSQYMRGATSSTSFHTNYTDSSAPPNSSPRVSTIVGEVCRVLSSHAVAPDASTLYLVYTSNFPRSFNACAWHSWGMCNGVDIQVAYMPNLNNINGCSVGGSLNCNSYSLGTQSLANASSHEFMETITDANISAWLDSSGAEIGDKCVYTYSSCVNLTTGNWQLQKEWSNQISACAQQ